MNWVFLAPIAAIVSILFGGYLFTRVQQAPIGTEKTARVTAAIAEGANAYLRVLYIALVVVAAVLSIVLLLLFGWQMALAFVFGAACSAVAGYFGMGQRVTRLTWEWMPCLLEVRSNVGGANGLLAYVLWSKFAQVVGNYRNHFDVTSGAFFVTK